MANMVQDTVFAQTVWQNIKDKKYQYIYFDGYYENKEDRAYIEQIGMMDSEWRTAVGSNSKYVNLDAGLEKTKKMMEEKKKDAEKVEASLFKEAFPALEVNYLSINNSEKIKCWTKAMLFDGHDEKLWDATNHRDLEVAFALFINSKEFIEKYRISANYSAFYSTKYGEAMGKKVTKENKNDIREEFMNKLTNYNTKTYRTFKKELTEQLTEYFEDSGIKDLKKMIDEAFKSIREDLMEYNNSVNATNTKRESKGKNALNKEVVFENQKKILKKILEELLQKQVERAKNNKDWLNKRSDIDGVLDSFNLYMGEGDNRTVVLKIATVKNTSSYYKTVKDASPKDKRNSFIAAVEGIFEDLRKTSLSMEGFSLSMGFIKNFKLEGIDFWNCVEQYKNQTLRKVVEKIFSENSTFFTQDWNASVMTGMLGELSTYLTHGSKFEDMKMTGTTVDKKSINGEELGLGESFKDLTFFFNKNYGINVKRYTSKEGDSFTLYEDNDKGIGINSQYMYRYFTEDEVELIRFIALNKNFITKSINAMLDSSADELITNFYQTISAQNLDKFIRLSSAASDEINLLYVINNLTIPASVIYNFILQALEDVDKARELFQIQINNTPDAQQVKIASAKKDVLGKYNDLPSLVEESNNLLRNSIKIKFKGLTLTNLGQIFR